MRGCLDPTDRRWKLRPGGPDCADVFVRFSQQGTRSTGQVGTITTSAQSALGRRRHNAESGVDLDGRWRPSGDVMRGSTMRTSHDNRLRRPDDQVAAISDETVGDGFADAAYSRSLRSEIRAAGLD